MAVQMDYFAPQGWVPPNDEEYLVVRYKLELADGVNDSKFLDATASVAAESSTGTWTAVDEGPDSGFDNATKFRALVYDIDEKNSSFSVAYRTGLFELGNMSGFLAGPVGNVAGMKMLKGLRVMDIRFSKPMVYSFPGPKYGVKGLREMLGQFDDIDDPKRKKMPLLGTVPKPKVGRTAEQQAVLARELWTAGDWTYDFIKDDENLTSLGFSDFYDRIKAVLQVQKEVEAESGNRKFYLANVTHSNLEEVWRRVEAIRENGGRYLMIDVVTSGVAAVHTLRLKDYGLAIHAHRAMHGFMTRDSGRGISSEGKLAGFSVSMLVLAKIYRLLGVDSLHIGSPKAKMEDYGESELIARHMLQDKNQPDLKRGVLGQEWYGMREVWPVASGGLHPGVMDVVVKKLGSNILIQMGGGVLGHPQGIRRGVEAALEARKVAVDEMSVTEYAKLHPLSALAKAIEVWGTEPRIVY